MQASPTFDNYKDLENFLRSVSSDLSCRKLNNTVFCFALQLPSCTSVESEASIYDDSNFCLKAAIIKSEFR